LEKRKSLQTKINTPRYYFDGGKLIYFQYLNRGKDAIIFSGEKKTILNRKHKKHKKTAPR
jgi:hypothetical protein